jgi:hypothetical protein
MSENNNILLIKKMNDNFAFINLNTNNSNAR